MSTKFGILIKETEEIKEVAFRGNGTGIRFTDSIAPLLSDDHPVIALTNSPQGIYTIGDIKKAIDGKSNMGNTTERDLLMEYERFGCTPEFWEKEGIKLAKDQIDAFIKSRQL